MLFSEPKIPQSICRSSYNGSGDVSVLFSEPKIPQSNERDDEIRVAFRFSALQRAENSSIEDNRGKARRRAEFQCSSASRKFLNLSVNSVAPDTLLGFSALQRAENSSMFPPFSIKIEPKRFQCSSASRKFLNVGASWRTKRNDEFQCSSASRKFLNSRAPGASTDRPLFQCSSASRKFLNANRKG